MITGHYSSGWGNAYALQPSKRTMVLSSPRVATPIQDIRFQARRPALETKDINGLSVSLPKNAPTDYKAHVPEVLAGIERNYQGLLGKIGSNGWTLTIIPESRKRQTEDVNASKKQMKLKALSASFSPDGGIYKILAKAINQGALDDRFIQAKGIWPYRTFLISNNPDYIAFLQKRTNIHPRDYQKQFEGSIVMLFEDPALLSHEGPLPREDWIRQMLVVNE